MPPSAGGGPCETAFVPKKKKINNEKRKEKLRSVQGEEKREEARAWFARPGRKKKATRLSRKSRRKVLRGEGIRAFRRKETIKGAKILLTHKRKISSNFSPGEKKRENS